MIPILMLIFVVVLMLLFIILAFLQKQKEPFNEETILTEDIQKIKNRE